MIDRLQISNHIKKGDTVICAVSGGSDSKALLHYLATNFRFNIIIAHVNHSLRKTSMRDESFVRALAKKYKTKVVVLRQDVEEYAKVNRINLEDAGRRIRYGFFHKLARDYHAQCVITAHHLDDRIEGILLNLVRGAGLQGMIGFDEFSYYPNAAHKKHTIIFRPFINTTKAHICEYLQYHKLHFVEDETNNLLKFSRNRIRHTVIPSLLEINPNLHRSFQRCTAINADIHDYLASEARIWRSESRNGFSAISFNQLHIALRREVLRQIYMDIYNNTHNLSFTVLEDVIQLITQNKTSKYKNFGPRWIIKIIYNKVYFLQKGPAYKRYNMLIELQPGETLFRKQKIVIQTKKVSYNSRTQRQFSVYLDPKKLKSQKLFLRFRKPGDRFTPSGMKGQKKLQDFFVDNKVEKSLRDLIPLIVTEDGRIVWVVGMRPSQEFMPRAGTKEILEVKICNI